MLGNSLVWLSQPSLHPLSPQMLFILFLVGSVGTLASGRAARVWSQHWDSGACCVPSRSESQLCPCSGGTDRGWGGGNKRRDTAWGTAQHRGVMPHGVSSI